MTADRDEQRRVKRRHVFYISGYDPRGPSHYHRLYREEAAKQASINGLVCEVGPRRSVSPVESMWDITSAATVTAYSFLRYDDLMRRTVAGVMTREFIYAGRDTPASYRPSTGALTTWDRWPVEGRAVAPTSVRVLEPGAAVSVERSGPCDRVVVAGPR